MKNEVLKVGIFETLEDIEKARDELSKQFKIDFDIIEIEKLSQGKENTFCVTKIKINELY